MATPAPISVRLGLVAGIMWRGSAQAAITCDNVVKPRAQFSVAKTVAPFPNPAAAIRPDTLPICPFEWLAAMYSAVHCEVPIRMALTRSAGYPFATRNWFMALMSCMALTGPDGVTWLPLYVGEAVSVGPGVRVNVRVKVGPAVRVREGVVVGPGGVFVKVGTEVVDFFVGVGDRYRVGVLLDVGNCVAPCKV